MFCICRHFENCAKQTKLSSKERVIKFLKRFQPQNAECINQIKLNYFEHINILESCNQPGIDNKSSNFIPEMVSCLEIKIQGFCLQKISEVRKAYTVKCPKINIM